MPQDTRNIDGFHLKKLRNLFKTSKKPVEQKEVLVSNDSSSCKVDTDSKGNLEEQNKRGKQTDTGYFNGVKENITKLINTSDDSNTKSI